MRRIIHITLFLLVLVALIVATITIVGQTIGSLVGGSIMVALIAYLIGWGASGYWLHIIARRRFTPADAARGATIHAVRAQSMMLAGECARPWLDSDGAHLCVRGYDHTGPCTCGICDAVAR